MAVIKLSDYINKEEKGLSGAVNRALAASQKGDTLLLGGGELHFYKDGTVETYYCVSNNDKGVKKIVFALQGKEGLTIDGEGAELIFHGEILPFAVDSCSGITVKNINIDYASPMYVQAEICNASEGYYELQFDGEEFKYRVRDGKIWIYNDEDEWEEEFRHSLTIEMDGKRKCPVAYQKEYITETEEGMDHGFLSRLFHHMSYQDLGNNRLAVKGDAGYVYQNGNYWIGTFHYIRRNPGIFVTDSKDVTLEQINLYHALAMGVIVQTSENITLERVNTRVREGSKRFLSVCADSTHFVNCRGKIKLTDCVFTNMLDDALNIHGIYHKLLRKEGGNKLYGGVGHFQQVGILSYKPGDTIGLVDVNTGEKVAEYTVKKAELLSEDEILIETEEQLAEIGEGFVIENLSANPEIEILGCESGNNRPRGFLLSSPKKTLVEDCTFYNMYSAISIGGGVGGWYESGCVKDVTIRGNHFINAAFTGGTAILIQPGFANGEEVRHFSKGIVIEDNTFEQAEKRILRAYGTDGLVFKGNHFVCNEALPHHEESDLEDGVLFKCCDDVVYEEM